MALPAAASNAAFLARLQEPFSSSEMLCHVWKGSSLAPLSGLQRGCPRGQEGLEACSHVQPWPSSLSALLSAGFSLQGWCHVPHLSTDASFWDPVCQAPMSRFGGLASAPSPDTEADTGPQCCPNERGLVGSVGCFSNKSNLDSWVVVVWLIHIKLVRCTGPSSTVSCGQSGSALQALGD